MMEVVDLTREDTTTHCFEFTGKPVAMPRPRTSWKSGGYFYNPASKAVLAHQAMVRAAIPATQQGVLFPAGVPVAVKLTFYMKRPNSDFRGNRLLGFLRAMAPIARPIMPDIDNLAKFMLDVLNKVVFADDRQVVKLVVLKLQDSDGLCQGRTMVEVSEFDPVSLL